VTFVPAPYPCPPPLNPAAVPCTHLPTPSATDLTCLLTTTENKTFPRPSSSLVLLPSSCLYASTDLLHFPLSSSPPPPLNRPLTEARTKKVSRCENRALQHQPDPQSLFLLIHPSFALRDSASRPSPRSSSTRLITIALQSRSLRLPNVFGCRLHAAFALELSNSNTVQLLLTSLSLSLALGPGPGSWPTAHTAASPTSEPPP
jgi:hypothetical protein